MNPSDRKRNRWLLGAAAALVGVVLLGLLLWSRYGPLEMVEPAGPMGVELPPLEMDVVSLEPVPKPSRRIPQASPAPGLEATPTPKRPMSDRERLEEITSNWVYRGYAGVGQDKTGRFTHHQRGESDFFVTLGDVVDGVTIEALEKEAAVARLRQATVTLILVPELRISPEQMAHPGIPTEEEVRQAKTAYWENYGKRFQVIGKRYTPRKGERMPPATPPSPEQVATAKARYMATWVPRLRERQTAAQRRPTPTPAQAH